MVDAGILRADERVALIGELVLVKPPTPAQVEISHSSLSLDRVQKASLYAKHGLPEYWVLDGPPGPGPRSGQLFPVQLPDGVSGLL